MTAVTTAFSPSQILTYESYMAEETDMRRYDILDGKKVCMPGVTDDHQDYQGNLFALLRTFEQQYRLGKARMAPRDVLITRVPLRTRQPDVFFISNERRALNPASNDPAPMTAAPELVVEVISDSETQSRFTAKITDYCDVNVRECWKVMPDTQTVEVLRLSCNGAESVRVYGRGESVQSIIFPSLNVTVEAIFAN